jgi:hypothetical protein
MIIEGSPAMTVKAQVCRQRAEAPGLRAHMIYCNLLHGGLASTVLALVSFLEAIQRLYSIFSKLQNTQALYAHMNNKTIKKNQKKPKKETERNTAIVNNASFHPTFYPA